MPPWQRRVLTRLRSARSGEWPYVFRPDVGGDPFYLKVVLRADARSSPAMTTRTKRAARRPMASEPIAREGREARRLPDDACTECGDTVTDFAQTGALWERAFARYRARNRLLGPDEIRALRRILGLTQAGLAHLLRLGANTVSRWEAGRNIQTAAMDVLLRLLRDVPGSLAYLKRHAAWPVSGTRRRDGRP